MQVGYDKGKTRLGKLRPSDRNTVLTRGLQLLSRQLLLELPFPAHSKEKAAVHKSALETFHGLQSPLAHPNLPKMS